MYSRKHQRTTTTALYALLLAVPLNLAHFKMTTTRAKFLSFLDSNQNA